MAISGPDGFDQLFLCNVARNVVNERTGKDGSSVLRVREQHEKFKEEEYTNEGR